MNRIISQTFLAQFDSLFQRWIFFSGKYFHLKSYHYIWSRVMCQLDIFWTEHSWLGVGDEDRVQSSSKEFYWVADKLYDNGQNLKEEFSECIHKVGLHLIARKSRAVSSCCSSSFLCHALMWCFCKSFSSFSFFF